jgi:acetoacetyl-CoA reductase
MLGLEDKVILVTGGSRGIGEATVKLLEELGAVVAYISQNDSHGRYGSLFIKADVTKKDEMETAIKRIENVFGPIYGIVANAGITRDNLISKMSDDNWNEVINVNLHGVYNTVKPAISSMYERKEGSIVFISSIVGERGNIGQTNYSATKAAVIGLAKSLAKEGARFGVRSNVVAPGFTETDMLKPIPPNIKEKIISEIPLRRFGKPEDIAWSIAFLLSPVTSNFVTGEVIRVNGGQHT